jgi:hypothetical protein
MGSGISSTSKICVISTSERKDADLDYTFVQVGIKGGDLDMAGNCGNMSSAVGPVAWDEGLIEGVNAEDGEPLGDYSIDGVSGQGSRITLSFLDPAGAKTDKALPTGRPVDELELQDGSKIRASLIDVANPGVFVLASDVNVPGDITSDRLGADTATMSRLEEIRRAGATKMGLDPDIQSVPKIVMISSPTDEQGVNIVCRALSMQQAHKASPLTLALNLGAACRLPGTLPAMTAINAEGKESVVIAHASGKLEVGSVLEGDQIISALLHRTARVLMKGEVYYSIDGAK